MNIILSRISLLDRLTSILNDQFTIYIDHMKLNELETDTIDMNQNESELNKVISDEVEVNLNGMNLNLNINNMLEKIIDSEIYYNSYAFIVSDFFNLLVREYKQFDLSSIYTMREGYVFRLRLSRTDNIHDIVVISGYSDDCKYIIIFPCVNKVRKVNSLHQLIDDYFSVKIDQGFTISGDYGKYNQCRFEDLYYLLEYIILNNVKEENIDDFSDKLSNFFLSISI